ncbi:MAG: heavy metal translocating P-type ATPase [Thermotogota bacterium]
MMENSIKDVDKQSFYVKGMTCATCAQNVKRALDNIDGVSNASVNLATETAFVISNDGISFKEIEQAVRNAGYQALKSVNEIDEEKRLKQSKQRFLISIAITIPLSVLMFFHMSGVMIPGYLLMEIVFGGLVVFYTGYPTIKSAWIALVHRHTNMDTLIFMGSVTAWLTAVFKFFGLEIASFGALGAMIVALHLTGKFIEQRLKYKAAKEIKALMNLQSNEATIIQGEKEINIPVENLKPGDVVMVRPGERVPTDGILIRSTTSVDESMLTGESMPVKKQKGDQMTGGSLNLTSSIRIEVNKEHSDTFLSQMVSLINEAQGTKVPIQALADQITRYFVPIVIMAALLGALLWYFNFETFYPMLDSVRGFLPWILVSDSPLSFSIFVFVSSIVIACPCALGLATPMALVSGMGLATKKGVLIRNSEVVQSIGKTDVVVLDKTGTITQGVPKVILHNLDENTQHIVALIESQSNHPLAKAISEISNTQKTLKIDDIQELSGKGVLAQFEGNEFFIGRPKDYSKYEDMLELGQTVVEVTVNDTIVGFLAIEDPLREESVQEINELKKRGLEVVIATGDNQTTAKKIARRVGADSVYAQLMPSQKVDIINNFQSKGYQVLMAGDGINDAAALRSADIGVSFSTGTDLAMDNSDIVVVNGGISGIRSTLEISNKMMKVIKQNLFWAFFYNVIAIPVALMGWLHPAISEAAMGISSISVVLNSLRIKSERKKGEENMKYTVIVGDMNCQHCAATIDKALENEGIKEREIDLENKTVTFDSSHIDKGLEAIQNAGYTPEV